MTTQQQANVAEETKVAPTTAKAATVKVATKLRAISDSITAISSATLLQSLKENDTMPVGARAALTSIASGLDTLSDEIKQAIADVESSIPSTSVSIKTNATAVAKSDGLTIAIESLDSALTANTEGVKQLPISATTYSSGDHFTITNKSSESFELVSSDPSITLEANSTFTLPAGTSKTIYLSGTEFKSL